ncbi:hypothetical protein SA37_0074 [Salmonella enterica subsp. enterica serovar Agona str. 37.F.02]|nr:hypothetical protein SA37_0074 [Salmonella enterica subsp. enterica serovar Agona str. 37.F.02]
MRVKQICRPDKAFTPPSGIVFVKIAGSPPADAGIYRYSAQSCGLLTIPIPDGSFALSGLRFDCSGFQE